MKIAIVGGGISGIATYLALRKHLSDASPPASIVVYEALQSIDAAISARRGGFFLPPNGLRAIKSICADAEEYIRDQGRPCEAVTLRTSAGKSLGKLHAGRKTRYGIGQVAVSRAAVYESLLRELRPGVICWGRKVRYVKEHGDCVKISLEDGSEDTVDVVIGADGLHSVARKAIYPQSCSPRNELRLTANGSAPLSALPATLRIPVEQESAVLTFGAAGCFGYARMSRDDLMWWSTFPQHEVSIADTPLEQLRSRHARWQSPIDTVEGRIFRDIIAPAATEHAQLQSGPLSNLPFLPHWSSLSGSGRILLIGNTAHPIPLQVGQSLSCAVEDGLTIALLLKHYRVSHRFSVEESLKRTGKAFEDLRMKRVRRILRVAQLSVKLLKSRKRWVQALRNCIIWIAQKLPEAMADPLYRYDVEVEIAKYIPKSDCEPKVRRY
ncbi:unnamed protein product [Mycena citricolor]|uniref:FAD-binding domain-containing protein n=1 Tax=Mycena citricolor TaxID=2018698 RepID=A0AAD2Q387_9AGAR|nr:unnamed protein product [Mycena citricolor]